MSVTVELQAAAPGGAEQMLSPEALAFIGIFMPVPLRMSIGAPPSPPEAAAR